PGLPSIPAPTMETFATSLSMSTEARQKLDRIRPRTIGQAARIPGISPHDVSVLLVLSGR
ncbi:MAG: hypothetical protein ACFN22_05915, partial [Porphyromonas pasteri]